MISKNKIFKDKLCLYFKKKVFVLIINNDY